MKVLSTGATGFVGQGILNALSGQNVTLIGRRPLENCLAYSFINHDLEGNQGFDLVGYEGACFIHCAAKVPEAGSNDDWNCFKRVNVLGTLRLARIAAKAGVRRFIYVSSIKVNGETSPTSKRFSPFDEHDPVGPYGKSKSQAEQKLIKLGQETGMEVVIIRPPLVYGPGVKANFASLMELVFRGAPLPFGCITDNRRSLVSVTNLIDLIVTCIDHPKAAGHVFLVSDDNDVSTSEMVRKMAASLGKPAWQLPVPVWCCELAGKFFGKSDVVDRLIDSLQVDITHTKETLNWKPPQSLEDGFKEVAQALLNSKK